MKVYKRTENGSATIVDRRTGLDEINAAMIGDTKKTVRTMSSISRTDYAIDYKDGRSVRLVLIDAPAPEGYFQGQAVVVQRPGQPTIRGTVAHIHSAPGYVAVLEDRHRAVSTYPTNFVQVAATEQAPESRTAEIRPGRTGQVVTANGKDYVVGKMVPANRPVHAHAPKGWEPTAYIDYWSMRNGKAFGPVRTTNAEAKPGTVGALIWAQVSK
jgi:hypothetical protein